MIVNLTQKYVDTALIVQKGKAKAEFVDSTRNGLYVNCTAATPGQGTYFWRTKNSTGTTVHLKIGRTTELTLAAARAAVQRLRAEQSMGKDHHSERKMQKTVLTLGEFWTDHYKVYAEPRKRSFSRDEQLWRIRIKGKFGALRLNQITRHQVQSFHTELLAEGLAPASCDHHLKLMKYMFNLAHDWQLYEGLNPVARVPLYNADNKVQNILSNAELERLITVLRSDKNRPVCLIIQWLLCTGMRLGATLEIRWDQLNRERRVLVIPSTISKSKRNSSIPLNDSAMSILDQLDTEGKYEYLFVNKRTGKTFVNVTKVWHRLRKQAGLPQFRLHDSRHTYASLLADNGVSLYTIQTLLNHQSPVTTQRYAHLSSSTLLNASNNASAAIQNAMQPKPITIDGTAVEVKEAAALLTDVVLVESAAS